MLALEHHAATGPLGIEDAREEVGPDRVDRPQQGGRAGRDERVGVDLPVRVVQAPQLAGEVQAGAYRFQDLSGSGAALVGPQALGEVGQSLQVELAFSLAATGTQELLVLGADIQTVQPLRDASGQGAGFVHGIRFHRVEPCVLLLVSELQKPLAHGASRA